MRIVVAGIAGSGKTTIGRELADRLDVSYVDGDSLHPMENIAKMSAGMPLADEDRWPWLAAIGDQLRAEDHIVVSCSALRRSYRDMLRGAADVEFVFLDANRDIAVHRVADRADHYMGPEMIDSQLAALERPESDETDVVIVDCDDSIESVVESAILALCRPFS